MALVRHNDMTNLSEWKKQPQKLTGLNLITAKGIFISTAPGKGAKLLQLGDMLLAIGHLVHGEKTLLKFNIILKDSARLKDQKPSVGFPG